jgi:hypothetical protein
MSEHASNTASSCDATATTPGMQTYVPKEQLDYCTRSLKGTRDALESADTRIAELEAENEGLRSRRLPCAEAEVAQKRYEDAEAERDKWEWVARHADRPSLMDRPNLCERSDAAIAFILARWAGRETP